MTDLKIKNKKGFLVAPHETQELFQNRCDFLEKSTELIKTCEKLKFTSIEKHPPLVYEDLDLEVNWLLISQSTKGLPFWEAAATWMIKEGEIIIPLLQFKKRSKNIDSEIVKHELIHIARSSFEEPIYEEFLAYATSKCRWRRLFGPVFRSSKESLVFVVLALLPSFTPWLLIPIAGYSIWLLVRLMIHQRIFQKALVNLSVFFQTRSPLKIAIRLTDEEIKLFSEALNIQAYISNQNCLRWEQIKVAYLQNS